MPEHQRKADEVEGLRPLAQDDHRHDRAEHRRHVEEGRGAVGTDQRNPAVEAEIGKR